jgi:Immunoglobulin-like domain of bacterial spore germination
MTDKQQSAFFLLIVFFFTCGAGLLIYRGYNLFYQESAVMNIEAADLAVQKVPAPAVLADGRLQVDSPKKGATVGRAFTVSGFAQDWFEGNITIKVFDNSGQLLYQGNAIAEDNYGHPAPFKTSVTLIATPATPTGRIEFNDYSAKDGSLAYQKTINIKFAK